MPDVKTHMMFQGEGEAALELYKSVFANFDVKEIETYGEGEGGTVGAFKTAYVSFSGHDLILFDSPPMHDFTFTPSMSLFVDFESEAELDEAFKTLSDNGEALMPPGNYGFSQKFSWIKDRFGMSWQLNLP